MPTRAAIYCRVSIKDQADNGTSLRMQMRKGEERCEENGWTEAWRAEEDASGYTMDRPCLRELLKLVRAREVDVVIGYALDRISRDQQHQNVIAWMLFEDEVTLELITEKFDDTPQGRFLRAAMGFVSEVEREKILLRTSIGAK